MGDVGIGRALTNFIILSKTDIILFAVFVVKSVVVINFWIIVSELLILFF